MRALAAARIRAVFGVLFALLGVAIGVQLLTRPDPLSAKLVGLAFCVVLILLGVVRVRMYLRLKAAQRP